MERKFKLKMRTEKELRARMMDNKLQFPAYNVKDVNDKYISVVDIDTAIEVIKEEVQSVYDELGIGV